jgi:hypothetical protein
LIDQFIDQVGRRWQAQDEEIAAAGTQPATVGRALRRACEELASEDVRLFERFRREWLIAAIEEDPQGFHANLEPEGRATKRERADWTSLAAAVVDEAAIRAVLDDRVLDGLLSARADLRDDGGWLAPGQRARLERADESDVLGWRVLKAVRNILTHDSDNALGVLRTVMDELGGSSSPLAIERSIRSKRDAIAWLANDAGPAASGRGSRLSRSRLAVLHGTVIHVAASMRSEPLPG